MRDAVDEAKEFLRDNFLDEIVEQLVRGDEVSDDIYNDYPNGDELFHEQITDYYYSPREAVNILEEYGEHEETDSGLWEGASGWEQILGTIAAYTFSNAVMYEIRNFISEINEIDVDELRQAALEPFREAHEEDEARKASEADENEEDYDYTPFDEDKADIEDVLTAAVRDAVESILE